jgi:hypothetical protein
METRDLLLKFDDVNTGEFGDWSQVCESCVVKLNIDRTLLVPDIGSGICGVDGCSNGADHYIDF